MLNEEMSAGTNAEQSKNDETRFPSSPTIGNTNVIGSQSPQEFTVWNLLDTICDGLIGFKASGKELYKVKTTLELPTESYNRFCDFLKMRCPDAFNETEILYAGFKFCVKELS